MRYEGVTFSRILVACDETVKEHWRSPAVKNRRFFAQDISHNGVRLGDEDNKKPKDDIVR